MCRIFLLFLLFLFQPLTSYAQGNVTIDNSLNDCIKLKGQKSRLDNGLLLVDLEFEWIKTTAHCRCKSLVNHYSVREDPIEGKFPIYHSWGNFVIRKDLLKVSLPITPSYSIYSDKKFYLVILCARPA